MRLKLYAVLLALGSMGVSSKLFAQADTLKYKERLAAVNQEVWGWKVPAFANRKIPADYANESSVILARRAMIEANSKRKMDWGWGGPRRSFYYNSTVRELVKINDKASLEEYSQLSFSQFKKLNGWVSGTATTFVGARIIKPDGSMKQISIDESVTLQTAKNDIQRKLPIADLQVGDILDYFIRVEEYSVALREPEKLIFIFGDDHPILDYSIYCNIGDKYAVEYRSMNKAPDAKQTTDADKDLILDLDLQNIPAMPTGLWMSSLRQIPAFRINVLAGSGSGRSKGDVIKDVPLTDILNRTYIMEDPMLTAQLENKIHPLLVKATAGGMHFYKLPKDSLARLVYYAYRFALYYNEEGNETILEVGEARNHMEMRTDLFLCTLRSLLAKFDVKSHLVVMPSRFGPVMTETMAPADLEMALSVDVDKPFYITVDNMFTCPGYIPGSYEGQPCAEVVKRNYKKNEQVDLSTLMPLSTSADNVHKETLQVAIAGSDMQLLHIKRQTVLTGKMKQAEQLRLLNFEDCYEAERSALRQDHSIVEDLKKVRKSRNLSEDYATALQKARTSLKERFKDEVSSEFEEDPKEMISWKVDNPGIRDYAPNLVYSTEFTMDNLLQRAGPNFLLSIGKTVSSPVKLRPSQRTRGVDIFMPYARTIDYSVSFALPAGFTVQGVDKLNKTLENDCGSLVTSAQVQGSQLVVHFKRIYKHNYEAAAKWPQLLAILDASTDFAGQKVLLKRG